MRLVSYILLGLVNAFLGLSIIGNQGLWHYISSGQLLGNTGWAAGLTFSCYIWMYSTAILFAYYCFNIEARRNRLFWKINFAGNSLMVFWLTAIMIWSKIDSTVGASSWGDHGYLLVPYAIFLTLNLTLLLCRVPSKQIDGNNVSENPYPRYPA